jgi:predicted ester cyclase
MIGTYQAAFPDARWDVEEMLVTGDKVMTRWIGSGTHKGVLQGNPPLPPTGKKVKVTGVWIHRIIGGKIVESWNHWDMLGMLHQLGVRPTPQ